MSDDLDRLADQLRHDHAATLPAGYQLLPWHQLKESEQRMWRGFAQEKLNTGKEEQ